MVQAIRTLRGPASFSTDEGQNVVPDTIAATSACPPASEAEGDVAVDATANTDKMSAGQGYCILHKISEYSQLDIHEISLNPSLSKICQNRRPDIRVLSYHSKLFGP